MVLSPASFWAEGAFRDQRPLQAVGFLSVCFPKAVLCNGPEAEISEELCEGGGLVVGVEAAGVGEDPGVAAAEGVLLEADAGVFDAGDDAVGADADEGDDCGAPAFDFGFEGWPPARSSSSVSSSARAVARSTMLVMPNLRSRRRDSSKGRRGAG